MRILMVHNRYGGAARGGAERVVERLAGAFQASGHIIDVHHRTTVGFNVLRRLPALARAVWHLVDLFNIVAVVHLRATLRRVKPDVVHTHNLIGCGGLTPWVIRQSGIPWVHTLHDVQLITPSGLLTTVSPPRSVGEREGVRGDLAPTSVLERSFLGRTFRTLRRFLFGSPHVVTSPSRWLLELHHSHR
ncbi:MAG: glycosyltransferase, partial [bacterium]|nr:glycosyltransferase [bacterium]